MKPIVTLLFMLILLSSNSSHKEKVSGEPGNDSVHSEEVNEVKTMENTKSKINENVVLWKSIDKLNRALMNSEKSLSDEDLEKYFKEAVEISTSSALIDEFDKLRTESFESDDYTMIEQYVQRCNPAITVLILGESNSIGVNVNSFVEKCRPKNRVYEFFELAQYGFYFGSESFCVIGTPEFPEWLERSGSSFQGEFITEIAEKYLKEWESVQKKQKGFFKVIADKTIHCLSTEINE